MNELRFENCSVRTIFSRRNVYLLTWIAQLTTIQWYTDVELITKYHEWHSPWWKWQNCYPKAFTMLRILWQQNCCFCWKTSKLKVLFAIKEKCDVANPTRIYSNEWNPMHIVAKTLLQHSNEHYIYIITTPMLFASDWLFGFTGIRFRAFILLFLAFFRFI